MGKDVENYVDKEVNFSFDDVDLQSGFEGNVIFRVN